MNDFNFKYKVGDVVVVHARKCNGHPRALKDGDNYIIYDILDDGHLIVHKRQGTGFSQTIKVHKKYLITISQLRSVKINEILS